MVALNKSGAWILLVRQLLFGQRKLRASVVIGNTVPGNTVLCLAPIICHTLRSLSFESGLLLIYLPEIQTGPLLGASEVQTPSSVIQAEPSNEVISGLFSQKNPTLFQRRSKQNAWSVSLCFFFSLSKQIIINYPQIELNFGAIISLIISLSRKPIRLETDPEARSWLRISRLCEC